jgi:hypothetical protein
VIETRLVRIRRWILPASGVTVAMGALCFLLALELEQDQADPIHMGAALVPPVHKPAPAAAPPTATRPSPRPGPARRRPPAPAVELPAIAPSRTPTRETPQVLAASPCLSQLARCATLLERLDRLDDLLDRLPDDRAVALLEGLLDSQLPGDHYEAETLRLRVLVRLGTLPGPRADAVLVERLDPERPRPERLVALEMLAGRPGVGAGALTALAQDDHDQVVMDEARRALQRRGGS